MIQKEIGYVHGSAARQLQYDVYEQNKVLKEKKRYKNNRKVKLQLVLAIIAVLAAGLAVMYRYAIITEMSYEISQKENDFSELRNENAILKVQIETETDLTDIREIAENRLGMQTPDKSQIVYIKVPRNDYTVVMDTRDDAGDGGILNGIISKVSGLVSILE